MIKVAAFKFDVETAFLAVFILVFLSVILSISVGNTYNQQFVHLADAFLSGQTNFAISPSSTTETDYIYFNNKFYWPEAPFSAVLLMPVVFLFGPAFPIAYAQSAAVVVIFILLYKLARRFAYSVKASLWLASAFVCASTFLGLALVSWSHFFAQVVATLFLLLAVYEFFAAKRWPLIGTYVALAFFSRYTLIFSAVFFILSILFDGAGQKPWRERVKPLLLFLLPIFIVGCLSLGYNYVRFGTPFETGYRYANNTAFDFFMRDKYGLFNVKNIPSNFYYYFMKTPDPVFDENTYHLKPPYLTASTIGMSFFIVSPIFLLIFRRRPGLGKAHALINLLWATSIIQLLFLLLHYSPGAVTFMGPRYMADIMPWLFVLLLLACNDRGVTLPVKSLIVASAAFNLYLVIV